jgi:hypothetical protein
MKVFKAFYNGTLLRALINDILKKLMFMKIINVVNKKVNGVEKYL